MKDTQFGVIHTQSKSFSFDFYRNLSCHSIFSNGKVAVENSLTLVLTLNIVQSERSFLCADTGALIQEPAKRVQSYKK